MSTRPTIVCLCGSTRFWRTFQQASLQETLAGRIVLSIGAASGTDDEHFGNLPRAEYERVKAQLDTLHLRKIDLANEVLVLNVDGYIGESTAREIAYAQGLGKTIRWWEPDRAPDWARRTVASSVYAAEIREARRAAAGQWLREQMDRAEISARVAQAEAIEWGGGPYDSEVTYHNDQAVLLRWIWEQVDPDGYARWLDGDEADGPPDG